MTIDWNEKIRERFWSDIQANNFSNPSWIANQANALLRQNGQPNADFSGKDAVKICELECPQFLDKWKIKNIALALVLEELASTEVAEILWENTAQVIDHDSTKTWEQNITLWSEQGKTHQDLQDSLPEDKYHALYEWCYGVYKPIVQQNLETRWKNDAAIKRMKTSTQRNQQILAIVANEWLAEIAEKTGHTKEQFETLWWLEISESLFEKFRSYVTEKS